MYIFFQVLKTGTSILAISIFIYTVFLAAIRTKMQEKGYMLIFRLMCAVPLPAGLIHLYFCFLRGEYGFEQTMDIYKYIYIEALIPLLLILPYKNELLRRALSVVMSAAVFFSGFMMIFIQIEESNVHNYTTLSRGESFRRTVDTMREEYCLADWKEIDFDALLEEFLPRIEEADKNGDKAAYGAALTEFAYRFYDGHVWAELDADTDELTRDLLAGNDYGLSMFTLTDGETIAVCVDEDSEAYEAGIRNGTVIKEWDGTDVKKAAEQVECIYPNQYFPIKENEDMFRPIFLAGKGGDEVKVAFLDENGKEKETVLKSRGNYRLRLETAIAHFIHDRWAMSFLSEDIISDGIPSEETLELWDKLKNENNSTAMISENCGYLRVTKQRYDKLLDCISVVRNGYYPELTELYDEKLEELKAQGMDRLIIDARNNSGGFNPVGGALASLFSKSKYLISSFGEQVNGVYSRKGDMYVFPNGKWSDLPVIVLVNQDCASAGDGLADCLGKLPNVTLMGITASNGINQITGGSCYLTNSEAIIAYPVFLSLGEDGLPLIDTDASRECRLPLDVRIPVDKEAALKIFGDDNEDYELDFAMKYFDKIGGK